MLENLLKDTLLAADGRVVADHWVLVVVAHDGVLRVLHAVRAGREQGHLQRQQYTVVVDGTGDGHAPEAESNLLLALASVRALLRGAQCSREATDYLRAANICSFR